PLVHDGQPRRARTARRRCREVGADPAPHVAPGRHGGPHAGLRADPRGDDGDGGRLPDRAHAPDLRAGSHDRADRRRKRRADASRRGADRARADRHQARHRVLDDVADRLHVRRRGRRGVRERHVPPDDACVLQGAALPRRRRRHPRPRRRAGHPQHARRRRAHAEDEVDVPRRLARARRHLPVLGLLLEGLDHRRDDEHRLVRRGLLGVRARGHVPDGALHVPPLLPRLPGRAEPVRARALPLRPRARGTVDDVRPGVDPDRARGGRRVDPVRAVLAPDHELARARRAHPADRGAELDAGVGLERARARGHRRRLGDLRGRAACGAAAAGAPADARAQVLRRRALRRRLLPAGGGDGDAPAHGLRGSGDPRDRLRRRGAHAGHRPRGPPRPDGAPAHVRVLPRHRHGSARDRLPPRQMNVGDITSVLIWLPIAAALVIWVLPLSRYATGSLAVLVSIVEVGLWIEQAARFDFNGDGPQFAQRASWIKDLGVSYHVGEYAFSLWLVGLTVVVMGACIGYGFWVGRDRSRAYFGLMLMLTGATVGVFVAQDLLLFYAFFEAMLIPLYVLVGVWGGPGRLGATVKFVI